MVGSHILELCLQSDKVSKVTSIVRRPSGIENKKLVEVVHTDYKDYSPIKSHLADQDIAFFCIGAYTGAVPREEFRKITVDYPVELAKALKEINPNINFNLLSGQGADKSEKSKMMFAKDKGAAENSLSELGLGQFHTFRPAYIYPVKKRKEPNFAYQLSRWLYKPLFSKLGKNMSITSEDLAKAMFKIGVNGSEKEIWENKDMVEYMRNKA